MKVQGSAMAYGDKIGTIGDITGLKDPIPFLALYLGASLDKGNFSALRLLLSPPDGAMRRLMTLAGSERKLPRVPLVLEKRTFWIKNLSFQTVLWSGYVSCGFDSITDIGFLAKGTEDGKWDPYGWASGGWKSYGG